MAYSLEWRAAGDDHPWTAPRGLVSFLRVFHSAPAIKAFVRSRAFTREGVDEVRLSCTGDAGVGSVITSVAAIRAWNEREARLPPALASSRWEAAQRRLCARAALEAQVAAVLAQAEQAGVLDRAQVERLWALLDAMLDGLRSPPHGPGAG